MKRRRVYYVTAFSACTLFYILFIQKASFYLSNQLQFSILDEAYVTLNYARNLLNGHGLVWNQWQGVEAGEGYGSFLWTLILSILHLLPLSPSKMGLAVQILATGLLALALLFVKRTADRISRMSLLVAFLSLTITGMYFPLIYYSLGGLDTALLTFLTYLSVYLIFDYEEKRDTKTLKYILLCFASLILTQTTAIFLCILFAIYLIRISPSESQKKIGTLTGTVIAATFFSYIAFREVYFGEIFSNSFYVSRGSEGFFLGIFMGIKSFFKLSFDHLYPFLFLSLGNFILGEEKLNRKVSLLFGIFICHSMVSIFLGTESWSKNPLPPPGFIHAIPALILVSLLGLNRLRHALRTKLTKNVRRGFLGIFLLVLWIPSCGMYFVRWFQSENTFIAQDYEMQKGIAIKGFAKTDLKIAASKPGTIAYFSGHHVFDLSGKNFKDFAKGEKEEFSFIKIMHPDLVVHLSDPERTDFFKLYDSGYRKAPSGIWYQYRTARERLRPGFWAFRLEH